MSSDSSALSLLTRSKLHLSTSGRDSCSLHRWVLLKNSIVSSPALTTSTLLATQSDIHSAYPTDDSEDDESEEVLGSMETDAFMFPDAGQLVPSSASSGIRGAEAQWLDSLLEELGDDEDDDEFAVDSDTHSATITVEDDEFPLYSPLGSPMSSSDDLPNQPAYYPPSISVPYPVPYPPYQSSLIHAYHFDSHFDPLIPSVSAPYEDPLPYYDTHDIEDLPVPDAIEDTSDDESDAPTTPSIGMSSSSLSLVDAASIPLPPERSRLRYSSPRVYVDSNDSYFHPFEFDPLPFPDEHVHTSYNHYQEC
ncbi:hypothetical protein JR316_0003509 [Psilocybe cubensis]|uniref:Uncharacterized protein n=2 Tax=Psilocybe cubensis TaxID=181762 RepID=A0A8H7Y2K8_PSICU|nr:hypothetical protein JR316_0003509 [Psilocybe cubensis]KAH9484030.1 hypothetical protein JR316_0003509 [Psilocybe cubensis]